MCVPSRCAAPSRSEGFDLIAADDGTNLAGENYPLVWRKLYSLVWAVHAAAAWAGGVALFVRGARLVYKK